MTFLNQNLIQERRQTDERTIVLEQRVDGLHTTVGRVEHKIDGIVDALAGIVRIEERQIANAAEIARAHGILEKHAVRMVSMETQMPGLMEKAKWIGMTVIGLVGAVGTAELARLLK